jgi:hypothetical protein
MNRRRSALCIFTTTILWFSLALSQDSTMIMPPYLQAVTTESIYVLVESSTTDPITVEYGSSASYGRKVSTEYCDTTTNSTFVHNIKISGLSANTVYHYRAVSKGTISHDATFRTAPKPGTEFRFAWMADFRTGVTIHDSIAKRIKEAHPVMCLYGGDLAINSKYASFKEQFFIPHELALSAEVPFFNTPGNHEKWTPNTIAFTQSPSSSSGTQAYYSFDYGDMHVLVLNNEIPDAGGHGEDNDMKKMSENVFVPNHVNVVFNGHSHFFQHNLVSGIHHMVIGSAGAPLYDLGTAPYVVKSAKEYNYGIVDVTPSSFNLMVYNEKGMPLDTLSLKK